MSFSRRKFLQSTSLVALCAAVPLKNVFAETLKRSAGTTSLLLPGLDRSDAVSQLNYEAFVRLVNKKFSLRHGTIQADLKLIEVYDWKTDSDKRSAGATGKECFSAVFLGAHHAPLRQETYTVTQESLGTFSLLVVPIGKSGKKGLHYEAVFNRLHG